MHAMHVVGARPNFMKVGPVVRALARRSGVRQTLVHTGQHYDANMSDVFFQQLGLPRPDVFLGAGSGSHAVQTAEIMVRFEKAVLEHRPDLVLVYGDVNSTTAATLVSAKLGIRVAHVEAGLRSRDMTMPEEINRLVTDRLADVLFTPSADADENLRHEGVPADRIHCVGNVMIDTLIGLLDQARLPAIDGLSARYTLVTLHRPANVDDPARLERLVASLADISRRCQIVFPVHPRTRKQLARLPAGLFDPSRIVLLEPLGYLEFLALQKHALAVVTDSGGVQEETTYLGVPCLTLRANTERPVTVDVGTNILLGDDVERLKDEMDAILSGRPKRGRIPEFWDGHAGERIAAALAGSAAETKPIRRAA
jgi:UDP-N-acetylglucosamine 2-epimerase (non-hydrolysing)